jgi:hypothetical protein
MLGGFFGGIVGKIVAGVLSLTGVVAGLAAGGVLPVIGGGTAGISGKTSTPISALAQAAVAADVDAPAGEAGVNAGTDNGEAAANVTASVPAVAPLQKLVNLPASAAGRPQVSQEAIDAAKACVAQIQGQVTGLITAAKAITSRDQVPALLQQARTIAAAARTCFEDAMKLAHQTAPGVDTEKTVGSALGILGRLTGFLQGNLGTGQLTGGQLTGGQLTGVIGGILNQANLGGGVTGVPGLSDLLKLIGSGGGTSFNAGANVQVAGSSDGGATETHHHRFHGGGR